LFTKVIELRTTVKTDRDAHPKASAEYARLDAMQLALKLLANATSYGILIEVVVDERAAEVPCMIYHGGEATRRAAKRKRLTEDDDLENGFKWSAQQLFCAFRPADTGGRPVATGNCRKAVPR